MPVRKADNITKSNPKQSKTSSTSSKLKKKNGKGKAIAKKPSKGNGIESKASFTQDISKYFNVQAGCSDGSEDEDDDDDDYDEDDSFIDNSSEVFCNVLFCFHKFLST